MSRGGRSSMRCARSSRTPYAQRPHLVQIICLCKTSSSASSYLWLMVGAALWQMRGSVGEMVEEVFESLRELEDGRRWRQSMLVAYEKGGPRTGRLIRAEFEREEATVSAPRESGVAKL